MLLLRKKGIYHLNNKKPDASFVIRDATRRATHIVGHASCESCVRRHHQLTLTPHDTAHTPSGVSASRPALCTRGRRFRAAALPSPNNILIPLHSTTSSISPPYLDLEWVVSQTVRLDTHSTRATDTPLRRPRMRVLPPNAHAHGAHCPPNHPPPHPTPSVFRLDLPPTWRP